MSPSSSDVTVDNKEEGEASARRKLSENFIQLAVPCASCSSSSDHGMYVDKTIEGVTPARRKVSEQIIQLALPYWMWVSWSS